MSSRKPPVPAPGRGRARKALLGVAGTSLGAIAAFAILYPRGSTSGGADSQPWAPAPPAAISAIPWPALPASQSAALVEARRGLEQAMILYGQNDLAPADGMLSAAIDGLARLGKVPVEVGTYHLRSVESALLQKDYALAEKRALEWLQRYPDDIDHLFILGQTRFQAKRWSPAAESFSRVVALRPKFVDALRWHAQCCAQLGAQEDGLRSVRRSLELIEFPEGSYWTAPMANLVLMNAVFVLHRFQEYELLQSVARAYRTRFSDVGEVLMAEGVALANLGRFAEAEPLLRRALAAPENAVNAEEISFELGLSLTKTAKWAEAAQLFTALLDRNPYYAKAYYQLGLVFERLGKKDEAQAMVEKSRELAPSERELRREKELRGSGQAGKGAAAASRAYSLRGEYSRAEQALRAPDLKGNPYSVIALADFYLECLRAQEAEQVLQHAATILEPEHLDIVGRRGIALILRGESEKGLALLQAAAAREKEETFWRLRFASALLEAGKPLEAARAVVHLRKGDDDREASYQLGKARLLSGDAGQALALLGSISSADTRRDEWDLASWLALATLEAKGSPDDAERLLESPPEGGQASFARLRAQWLLAESRPTAQANRDAAREALKRFTDLDSSVALLRRQIAAATWAESGALRLALASLHAQRGEQREAVKHARLGVLADPRRIEAHRALVEWLADDREVFFRLRELREASKLAPADTSLQGAIRAIEERWLK